jgi:integrase/recombinase XerD
MTIKKYLLGHYTADTTKIYLYEIENYIANYPQAAGAVYKDIVSYIGALREKYSNASTLNRILCSIRAYYDFLCYTGRRSDNPARSIKLRDQRSRDIQLQDLFTSGELETLLNRPERYNNLAHRNRVLISLLVYQALLPGEMEALTVQDINLDTGSVYIKPTVSTNKRELQLRPNQVLLFYHYIHETRPKLLGKNKSDALLIGLRGTPMKAGEIVNHVRRSYKGLYPRRQVNAQTIRQSVIANLLKQGHDLSLVQVFAGHKYPSSTERYKQNEIETLRDAVQQYHPMK